MACTYSTNVTTVERQKRGFDQKKKDKKGVQGENSEYPIEPRGTRCEFFIIPCMPRIFAASSPAPQPPRIIPQLPPLFRLRHRLHHHHNYFITPPHKSLIPKWTKSTETHRIQIQMSPFFPLIALWIVALSSFGHALKVPFRVNDVLPVLPRGISWPVLNSFNGAVDLLPSFVGSVTPYNGSIEWKGACFYDNEAKLKFTAGDTNGSDLGGAVLYLKVSFTFYFLLFALVNMCYDYC